MSVVSSSLALEFRWEMVTVQGSQARDVPPCCLSGLLALSTEDTAARMAVGGKERF